MTEASSTCPDCGTLLPADSPQQLCPSCLLKQAFASRTVELTPQPASPPPSPEEIADKFPQFEITECLGRGGMGVVYKARQKSLNRWVAIKILAPEKIHDEKFAERFTREAHTLALLNHPNIVTVYDHGETNGLFYIVMEFVDGVNLRDLLRDGKMESAQALTIVPPICEALQYAHDKGIVHRDIKPENLLIDRDGRVKIADFGIASLVGDTDEKSGTPPYMAPEQGNHGNVDHRADIYALGAVLYEMLTGDRPNSPLDLPSQKVQLDIRIDDIVLRALSKEPERRYRTANEFRTVVEGITPQKAASDQATQSPTSTPSPAVDPRFARILGIIIIIAGALNGLSTLISLLLLPFIRRTASLGTNQFLAPFTSSSGMPQLQEFPGWLISTVIAFSVLFTLAVSTFCIIGGRHMYLGTSRKWALTGAIACCLTPLWWPLGLLVGVGAIVVWVMEKDSPQLRDHAPPSPTKEGPRLSILAVVAFVLQLLPPAAIILLLIIANIG